MPLFGDIALFVSGIGLESVSCRGFLPLEELKVFQMETTRFELSDIQIVVGGPSFLFPDLRRDALALLAELDDMAVGCRVCGGIMVLIHFGLLHVYVTRKATFREE